MATCKRNEHYIFVESYISTQEQLIESLKTCFIENEIECDFTAIVVSPRGQHFGYGFIWISDPNVYRRLVGEDEDGNCVQTEVVNRGWVPPDDIEETQEKLQRVIEDMKSIDFDNWDKVVELENQRRDLENKCKPNMIKVSSNATLKLPPFMLTAEQRRFIAHKYKSDTDIPTTFEYYVSPQSRRKDKSDINQNVLYASGIPKWVTDEHIRKIFEPYVDDTTTEYQLCMNKREGLVSGTYPFVNIIDIRGKRGRPGNRVAYVYFEPAADECRMLISVCRVVPICAMVDGRMENGTLYFNHPKNYGYQG